jgi:hypothetical protein
VERSHDRTSEDGKAADKHEKENLEKSPDMEILGNQRKRPLESVDVGVVF